MRLHLLPQGDLAGPRGISKSRDIQPSTLAHTRRTPQDGHAFLHLRIWSKVCQILIHLRSPVHVDDASRVCPGQHVANRSLYINLALLLWSFRILQRPEAPIDLGTSGFRGVIVFDPDPFEVDFIPRVEERRLRELMA